MALKQSTVRVSSALPWGDTHRPHEQPQIHARRPRPHTLNCQDFYIAAEQQAPPQPRFKAEPDVPRAASSPRSGRAAPCPPAAPELEGRVRCPLHMGTRVPTSSHTCPAKPASSPKAAGLPSPQSFLTAYLAKYCFFWQKGP